MIVAVGLAFAINIDAVELFKTFLRDPQMRAAMIKQTDAVFKQQEETEKRLAEIRAKTGAADYEEIKKQYLQEAERTKKTVAELVEIGVPIGWDKAKITLRQSYPICIGKEDKKERAVATASACDKDKDNAGTAYAWPEIAKLVFSLVLGGFLVGLGAPFWSSTVTGLTNIRSIAGSVFGGAKDAAPAPGVELRGGAGGTQAEKPQPRTPVDIFEAAKAAADALRKARESLKAPNPVAPKTTTADPGKPGGG